MGCLIIVLVARYNSNNSNFGMDMRRHKSVETCCAFLSNNIQIQINLEMNERKINKKIHLNQEFRREGWTEKRSAVRFCLGSGLLGSYNSD